MLPNWIHVNAELAQNQRQFLYFLLRLTLWIQKQSFFLTGLSARLAALVCLYCSVLCAETMGLLLLMSETPFCFYLLFFIWRFITDSFVRCSTTFFFFFFFPHMDFSSFARKRHHVFAAAAAGHCSFIRFPNPFSPVQHHVEGGNKCRS